MANGQGQHFMTNVRVLERSDDWQCASEEERVRARNRIHQIANSAILATTGHGHMHPHLQWYTRMEACCFYQHD